MSSKWELAGTWRRQGWEEISGMAASVHSLSRWGENVNFPTQRLATDNFYGRKLSPILLPSLLTGTKYTSPLPPPRSRGSLQSVGESRAESVLLSICWIAEVMCHRWERTTGMLVGRSYLVSRLLLRSFSKVKLNRFGDCGYNYILNVYGQHQSGAVGYNVLSLHPSRTHELLFT